MTQGPQLLARLDRIPVWPYSYGVIWAVGIGFFFAFFDIITIGLALPIISKQFHIASSHAIWAVTSSLIGYIIGSFFCSRISDYLGRRLALNLSMLFFSVGSLLSATSPDINWLIAWRFLIGMGIGAEIANVSTYMSELSPTKCRGRFNGIAVALGFMGFAVVPFAGLWLIPSFTWGWRLLFALGSLGGFVVLFVRRFIPESIRWQVNHGHLKKAEGLLISAESLAEKRLKKPLPEVAHNPNPSSVSQTSLWFLFKPPYLPRMLLFASIWFVYYLGNYGWLTLNTGLFLMDGFDLSNSLLLVSFNSLGFIAGAFLAIYINDQWQRKYLLSLTALVWALCLLVIAFIPLMKIILIIGFLAALTIALFIPQMYTFTAEVFPTGCRATGVSITDGIGHLGGAFCGQIIFAITALLPQYNKASVAFAVMGITALLTAFLLLLGPKMTRERLSN